MLGPLMLAASRVAGALRIDPRSGDAAYRELAKRALYDDVPQADFEAVANLMSCDVPAAPFATAIPTTAARWGAIDRHYIKCLQDRVILPALQQRFIDEADAFAPGNPTHVHQLDSSHSPFMSQPAVLAGVQPTSRKLSAARARRIRSAHGGADALPMHTRPTGRARAASRDRARRRPR